MSSLERYSQSFRTGFGIVYRKPAGKPKFKGVLPPRRRTKKNLVITLICDRLFARHTRPVGKKGKRRIVNDSRPSFTRVFPRYVGQRIVISSPIRRSLSRLPYDVRTWLIENYYVDVAD